MKVHFRCIVFRSRSILSDLNAVRYNLINLIYRNLSAIQDREICCYSISCKEKDNIGKITALKYRFTPDIDRFIDSKALLMVRESENCFKTL